MDYSSPVVEQHELANTLSASPEALEFLYSIGREELDLCMFSDSLVSVSDSGKDLGSFTVNVQPAYYELEGAEEQKCFLVHATSQCTVNDTPCGTSIFAYISHTFETLEQHHHESLKLKGHTVDKKVHVIQKDDKLIINKTITEGERVQKETISHDLSKMTGLILEASNLLVMRLLARRKIPQQMVFLTFDDETNLSTSTYRELGMCTQVIGKEVTEVYGIERTIQSEDILTAWQCYFLNDGHLASRVQIGSPIIMKLTQLPILAEADEADPKPVFGKKVLDWEEDMQLHSEFLGRKEELISDHTTYLHQHPEMKILLADFMQFLLLRKPDDVVSFAADFFGSFSSIKEREDTFRSSHLSSPFHNHKRHCNQE
ncbi:ciliogenesis-associated TTC17-interacting protein [Bombina bombina]|uniref:ciliogenesis-associated TTC17-interacting protein n=1 Tax=Bombina bombina TaxID=8345 RepID=UPI00235B03F7|nr:ciliogenesis-associated TTC17-interacting protein [Bombina bombina]